MSFVDAQAVADELSVDRAWVYDNASALGAIRLGTGPRARLRFDLDDVRRRLTCSGSRGSEPVDPAPALTSRRRQRGRTGTTATLLPVRGRKVTA